MNVKLKIFLDAVGLILSVIVVCISGMALFIRIIGVSQAILFSWNIYDNYRELKKENNYGKLL